jgi:hypothetical protein
MLKTTQVCLQTYEMGKVLVLHADVAGTTENGAIKKTRQGRP